MSEKDFLEVFSRRLRHYLSVNNMTQKDLAEYLGTSVTSVYNWANGIKSPRMDKVDAMCELFHCKRSDLVEYPDDNRQHNYYLNDETAAIAQEIFDDRDLRALFDAGRGANPQDLQMAADLLRRLKATNPDG